MLLRGQCKGNNSNTNCLSIRFILQTWQPESTNCFGPILSFTLHSLFCCCKILFHGTCINSYSTNHIYHFTLCAAPLCCASFFVPLQTPVVERSARRTWPSRAQLTTWQSPLNGMNFVCKYIFYSKAIYKCKTNLTITTVTQWTLAIMQL